MTPKEKAKELVWQYSRALQLWDQENSLKAIQCALIAVDEIILNLKDSVPFELIMFYIQVKQEIEKL